jgi:hypothetical protein
MVIPLICTLMYVHLSIGGSGNLEQSFNVDHPFMWITPLYQCIRGKKKKKKKTMFKNELAKTVYGFMTKRR